MEFVGCGEASEGHVRHRGRIARARGRFVTGVYQHELRAGWTLQPNFSLSFALAAAPQTPLSGLPGKLLKNAEVFSLQTLLKR